MAMRDRETLLFELNIIAACDKKTQLAWFNALEPEEREIVNAWFKETMECITKIMTQFKPILEQGVAAFQKFLEGLSPVVLRCIQEMAGENDAEDTG